MSPVPGAVPSKFATATKQSGPVAKLSQIKEWKNQFGQNPQRKGSGFIKI